MPVRAFFYPLLSLPAYNGCGTGSIKENPNAYDISERRITLACHYDLTDDQIDTLCASIRKILA